jgi:serine/threonine protein kinase
VLNSLVWQEIKLLVAGCESDYIVRLIEYLIFEQEVWIILEYCDKDTLEAIVKNGTVLSELEAAAVVKQVLYGLKHLHAKKQLHRDLKSGNVLLTSKGGS